jgi:Flp pilus assembly protein TadB
MRRPATRRGSVVADPARARRQARYASHMRNELEARPARPPILKRAVAGLILIAAAALAIHVVIGLVMTIFWVAVALVVAVAVIWALKTIVW